MNSVTPHKSKATAARRENAQMRCDTIWFLNHPNDWENKIIS
jgi:hypothetical protein